MTSNLVKVVCERATEQLKGLLETKLSGKFKRDFGRSDFGWVYERKPQRETELSVLNFVGHAAPSRSKSQAIVKRTAG